LKLLAAFGAAMLLRERGDQARRHVEARGHVALREPDAPLYAVLADDELALHEQTINLVVRHLRSVLTARPTTFSLRPTRVGHRCHLRGRSRAGSGSARAARGGVEGRGCAGA